MHGVKHLVIQLNLRREIKIGDYQRKKNQILSYNIMKQSRSKSAIKRNLSHTPSKSKLQAVNNSESQYYFCHYKNAIYMGGIKAFQKHGRGIMLHDNGTSVVTSYFNDFKNGHNIFYKQNCVMSIEYQKNKIAECVLRISTYLMLIRFDKNQKPQGRAVLIDYNNRSIFYVIYKKGIIKEKHQEKDSSVLNRIFDLENIQYLIGDNHSKAVKFQLQIDQNIGSQKSTNKFQSGFYKKGLLNGLGFILIIRNPQHNIDTIRISRDFYVKVSQRGYYTNGNLNGIGQKWFKNGNLYFGDFKDGIFEGRGILKNEMKKNWVYGAFQNGNMSELLDYSQSDDDKKLQKIIQSTHERKNNWINNTIEIESHQKIADEIDNILNSNPTQKLNDLKSKKLQVLKKIQDNFLSENLNENSEEQNVQSEQNKPKNNFYLNYLPQTNSTKGYSQKTYDVKSSGSTVKNYFYSKNDQKQEQEDIITQRKKEQNVQQQQSSIFKVKNMEPNNSSRISSNTSRQNYYKLIPKKHLESSRQKSFTKNDNSLSRTEEDRVQYIPVNQKRFIGRSKIFQQQQNSEQSLPKFNYSPFK